MQVNEDTCYDPDMPKAGRPRTGKETKKPSDYPQYVFRVSKGDKKPLDALLDEVVEMMNTKREPGDSEFTRSSVMARAVFRGLEDLKRKYSKG